MALMDETDPIANSVPMTRAQHRVWIGQSGAGDCPLYNLVVTYRFGGAIDARQLADALDQLVVSSDALQMVVSDTDATEPSMHRDTSVRAAADVLSFDSSEAREAWAGERSVVALDPAVRCLDCAVLVVPTLTPADGQVMLYWCQHHLVSDGTNIELLLAALAAIYSGAVVEPGPDWIDYAAAEAERTATPRYQSMLAYWAEKCQVPHELPAFYGNRFRQTLPSVRRELPLTADTRQGLERLLQSPGFRGVSRELSLFITLATAMLATAARVHGGDALRLGFPSHARGSEWRRAFGMFVGIGFLSVELEDQDSFRALARKVSREALLSFAHLAPGVQDRATFEAFSCNLNVITAEAASFMTSAGAVPVAVDWRSTGHTEANSVLDLNVTDFAGQGDFKLEFDLDRAVFGDAEQASYLRHFTATLDAMVRDADEPVATFALLDDDERQTLLSLGNGDPASLTDLPTLQAHFARQVAHTPDALALQEGERRLSFAELDRTSDALARAIVAAGVTAGDAVAMCLMRSIDMYPAIIGILKAGGVYVPLDASYPVERLRYMLENSGSTLLVANDSTPKDLIGTPVAVLQLEDCLASSDNDAAPFQPVEPAGDAAYIMYTSGSTGLPKGVTGTHSATLNRFSWMWRKYPFQSDEVCCQKTALSFVDSIWELFGPLLQGVPVVVIPDESVLDIFRFVDVLQQESISRLVIVPSLLSVLLDSDEELRERLHALELCVVSGEPLPIELARRFLNTLGQCTLLNLYGSTEVTADVTADVVTHDKLSLRMPIGKAIAGVQMYILDQHQNLMPRGAIGELCIAGTGLSAGYFRQDELNAEKFIANPYAVEGKPFDDGRLFLTGDLGRFRTDGLIEHHGRRDAQLKIRGHRIESAEIEQCMQTYDGVRSAVLTVSDDQRLYGFYLEERGEQVSEAGLREHIERHLPEYMVPSKLNRLESLPLLGNGKVDKAALKRLIERTDNDNPANFQPRTTTEEQLVAIWQQVLQTDRINLHADFFDIGGNSIAAMRIMVAAKRAGIALALKQILEIGNVADLARAIDDNPVHRLFDMDAEAIESLDEDGADSEESVNALLASHPAIGGRENVVDLYRLTPSQKGILFHILLEGVEVPLYITEIRCDVSGTLDLPVFREAWNMLVQRHDALRTVVLHEGLQEPLQVILERGDLAWAEHDVSHLPEETQLEEVERIAAACLTVAIPLDRAPLLRVTLIKRSDTVTHLIADCHHMLIDGWSLSILSNELLLNYVNLLKTASIELGPPGSFRDHVATLLRQDRSAVQDFWREKLAGFTAPTAVITEDRSVAASHATGNQRVIVDEESTSLIYEFARRCRVTPNILVQAAWALLLARYNDTDDVMFGFAVTGRSSGISNYENTVGMFVNSLPMRLQCPPDSTLKDWLQSVQTEQTSLVEYENSALVDIQSVSELPASAAMFDSLMVFQNYPSMSLTSDFPIEFIDRKGHENSHMPLTIEIFPGYCLEILVLFIEELFGPGRMDSMMANFVTVMKAIASAGIDATLAEISIMSDEELTAMAAGFNQTKRDYPRESGVADLINQQALLSPEAKAVSFEEQELSYRELAARVDALANWLCQRGVRPDELIAVCLPRSIDMLVALLAIQRAGAAYLPLDPDYPQHRIDHIVSDAAAQLMITDSTVELGVQSHAAELLMLDTSWAAIDALPMQVITHQAGPDHLAYAIYTSGSTGLPKGVMVTRANIVNFLHSMQQTPGLESSDALLAVTTVAFDIAALELYLPLICGARVDIASRELTWDGFALATRIEEQGITAMQATPTTWRLLLSADWPGSPRFRALVGGEPLPRDLCRALIPRVQSLWNMYGPTETTVWSTCAHITDAESVISIGRPIDNTDVLILDNNRGLCPVGIPGELCIGGDGVTRGYINREEQTREQFVEHPQAPDKRIYRTGDLARWLPDGRIECLGRIDSQVKLRGFRIELGEIESVLSEVDEVAHAVVNLFKDDTTEMLVAYIVPAGHDAEDGDDTPATEIDEPMLRERLREQVPHYMMPSAYLLLDSIPRTPNGKIDRKALPSPHASGVQQAKAASVDDYGLPENQPVTAAEKTLSAIFEKVLRREHISIHSNFFDLGGNSITAMQIMAAAHKEGLNIALTDIFELGTISLLLEDTSDSCG